MYIRIEQFSWKKFNALKRFYGPQSLVAIIACKFGGVGHSDSHITDFFILGIQLSACMCIAIA